MVPFAGWDMPVQYESIVKEHHRVRSSVGLFDVSHMGQLEVRGPRALETINRLITGSPMHVPDGGALYTLCCNAEGGIHDDLIVYRHHTELASIICNAGNRTKIASLVQDAADGACDFVNRSDERALLALQGPRAAEVLGLVGANRAQELRPFRFAQISVAGSECMVARTGYTGEDGFELSCSADHAPALWNALTDAGEPCEIGPAGLGCRDTLRLEARLLLYGNDIDETTNPFEAGLGWVVKLDSGDFVGRDALQKIKAERKTKAGGTERRLVGFRMIGRGIARHGYPIVDIDGTALGVVTSGSPGPTVGSNIGLGYVPTDKTAIGTKVGIRIREKTVDAEVVATPFYRRPRLSEPRGPSKNE